MEYGAMERWLSSIVGATAFSFITKNNILHQKEEDTIGRQKQIAWD